MSVSAARRPVVVGVSQVLQRDVEPRAAKEPFDLMVDAVVRAAEDSGAGSSLLRRTNSVRVVQGIWGYQNPASAIAESLGLTNIETGRSVLGGNHVQMMVNRTALDIESGARDVVVLTGAECGRTMGRAKKAGLELPWLEEQDMGPSHVPDVVYGSSKWTRHEAEMAVGIEQAVHYYSLFELALRHANGEGVKEHLDRISQLWASFNEVAQSNPHAWIQRPVSAEEIRTVSASNRPITFPYPKLMNANMRVDMGAALILCAKEVADQLGIGEDKRVYPLSGTDANDHYYVSERENLHSSPAIRLAGGRALELARTEIGELSFVDLYSCFPSAVQVAAMELGLAGDDAGGDNSDSSAPPLIPLTVTGGLTFNGGPLNNYVMHSIARTVELLRQRGEGKALVTANGGMLTKHSFGVYGKEPVEDRQEWYGYAEMQSEVDVLPRCEVAQGVDGEATIESYVVAYGAGPKPTSKKSYTKIYGSASSSVALESANLFAPSHAHLACRLADGRRTWANVSEPEVLKAMCEQEFCGRAVRVSDGKASILD